MLKNNYTKLNASTWNLTVTYSHTYFYFQFWIFLGNSYVYIF